MLNQDALSECIFHADHVICGRTLRPFTIWHAWMLDFVRSPLLTGGSVTAADLILAIDLCCEPASHPDAVPRPYQRPLPSGDFLRAVAVEGLDRVGGKFLAYLSDYLALPSCWSSGDSKLVRSPLHLYLVAVLIRHGKRSEPEAWATQYGYARHLVLALAEAGGNEITLVNDAEEKALRAAGHLS